MQDNPTTEQLYSIYILIDPTTDEVRYVGITKRMPHQRYAGHIQDAKRGILRYVSRWVLSLLQHGNKPIMEVIEQTVDKNREKFWVKFYRESGSRLTNLTDGGDGTPGHVVSSEVKDRIRAAAIKRWADPEFKAARRAECKGHDVSAETRKKIGDANRGRKVPGKKMPPFSAEHRRKLSIAGKGKKMNRKIHGIHSHPERFPRGQDRKTAKLKDENVRFIREEYAAGRMSQAALGRMFSLHPGTIHLIVRRKKWKHIE